MPHFTCVTCGNQFAATGHPPDRCPICEDERQFVNWDGQQWTTLDELRAGHHNVLKTEEPGLTGIGTQPKFAIGQRVLLVQSPGGNVLWDCISLIDDATVEAVEALGGLSAIAVSHPHLCGSMIEWSRAFGDTPVYVHAADRQHVTRPDPAIVYWEGETRQLGDGLALVNTGGHFEGSAVLHWAAGADGKGALLVGDSVLVVMDRRYVSFMYSIPNMIPLSPAAVGRILAAVEPLAFERIYGHFFGYVVSSDAKSAVSRSARRFLHAIDN